MTGELISILKGLLILDPSEFSAQQKAQARILRKERIENPLVLLDVTTPSVIYQPERFREAIRDWTGAGGIKADIAETGSLGLISAEPVIGIQIPGRARLYFGPANPAELPGMLDAILKQVVPEENLIGQMIMAGQQPWEGIPEWSSHPFFHGQDRKVMNLSGIIDPCSVAEYIAWGGYRSFAKGIRFYTDQELMRLIEESNLRGRSGSGFPAAVKWIKTATTASDKHYVLCNADESDPGGYMHRLLIESNPHLVLEGIMLASYIVGADKAVIYTRSRYPMAVKRFQCAISQARELGLIGQDIMNSGFSLDMQLRRGPGAFVCGEETALIASLEGKRGSPRTKPPYPAQQGLHGKPTLVHNVETFAQVPLIIGNGPGWYKKTGTSGSSGTKLFSLSGKINRLGVVEVPFGTPVGKIINEIGGGVRDGKSLKAVLSGGPSGKFISPDKINIRVDFDEFDRENLVMGSGSLVVLDQNSCPVSLMKNLMDFMHQESCGKCIPCRDGTKRIGEILEMITTRPESGQRYESLERFKGVTRIRDLAVVMHATSLCGLGKTAAFPVLSGLDTFRQELEEHVFERICRTGVCRNLRQFRIDPVSCNGCNICFIKCPENAIIGSPRQVHFIVEDLCSGCGKCFEVCKFNAVTVF